MLSAVHSLASAIADPAVFGLRGVPPKTDVLQPTFWDHYDNTTLIYDAVWLKERKAIRVFFPKLLGFRASLQKVVWVVNGAVQKPRRQRQFSVYDTLDIPCQNFAATIEMRLSDVHQTINVNAADHDRYAGRNVLYTQIKDDDLAWISDWVRAHQRNHGVDAVLIANNNSIAYNSEALRRTLAGIDGIAIADVVDVPLRYGPFRRSATNIGKLSFQQMILQNIMRDRWLAKARGVLLCDVDELVVSCDGQSIFDQTIRSWLKFTRLLGHWRFQQHTDGLATHKWHILAEPKGSPCASKYCVVPNSFMGRKSWAIHSLEGVNRRFFPASRKFRFFHCRSISTSWKNNRSQQKTDGLVVDQATKAFMQRTFPEN